MKISNDYLTYLNGSRFHNGLEFPINDHLATESFVPDRFNYIKKIGAGKKILHVGCADHLQLIDAKRASGIWMHDYLSQISSECLGIDINREAVNYINNKLGIKNVIYADVLQQLPGALIEGTPWDIVFLGEIIEHVSDPVYFLNNLRNGLQNNAKELLITAPNALRWENFRNLKRGIECINSDHRFWFTPYTLAKIVSAAGFTPIEHFFVTSYKVAKPCGIRSYLNYRRLSRIPAYRDTIILRASF